MCIASLFRWFKTHALQLQTGYNTTEATKNICYAKGESSVDYSAVSRWLKKFHLGCKNLDEQAKSGRPKTVDSEALLQVIEANPASYTQRVSGELSISQSTVVCCLHNFSKSI